MSLQNCSQTYAKRCARHHVPHFNFISFLLIKARLIRGKGLVGSAMNLQNYPLHRRAQTFALLYGSLCPFSLVLTHLPKKICCTFNVDIGRRGRTPYQKKKKGGKITKGEEIDLEQWMFLCALSVQDSSSLSSLYPHSQLPPTMMLHTPPPTSLPPATILTNWYFISLLLSFHRLRFSFFCFVCTFFFFFCIQVDTQVDWQRLVY